MMARGQAVSMSRDLEVSIVFTAGMQGGKGQQPSRGEPSRKGGACHPVAQTLGPAGTPPGVSLSHRGLAPLLRPVPWGCARPPPWTSVNHLISDGAAAAPHLPRSPPLHAQLLTHLPWPRVFWLLQKEALILVNKMVPWNLATSSPSCFSEV